MTNVIAHRGASASEMENTPAAFRRAVAMGSDGIELDARRTRDGRLVVHHDAVLADGTSIIDTNRVDLPAHICDLSAALDACLGAFVNLEIKNDPSEPDFDPSDDVADEVARLLTSRDEPMRWLVSSFRLETIDRVRQTMPAARTAWLVGDVPPDLDVSVVARGHDAVHPWVQTLTRDQILRCHGMGVAVNAWTCDDPVRIAELMSWGIDGICTNVPDVAIHVRSALANATGRAGDA